MEFNGLKSDKTKSWLLVLSNNLVLMPSGNSSKIIKENMLSLSQQQMASTSTFNTKCQIQQLPISIKYYKNLKIFLKNNDIKE